MTDPLFWLVLSLLFVTISLTIVLIVAIPAFKDLARAARSAEKLFDTLRREFPPTLEAIRLTGMEISDLTDDVSQGVQSAGNVVKQVDQSLGSVRKQAQKVQSGTKGVFAGFRAAWKTFTRSQSASQRRSLDRLPPSSRANLEEFHRSASRHSMLETLSDFEDETALERHNLSEAFDTQDTLTDNPESHGSIKPNEQRSREQAARNEDETDLDL